MKEDIEIREAIPEDAEAIRDLALKIWNACYPGIITQEQIDYMLGWMYAPERIRTEILKEGIVYLRVDDEAGLQGFAAFGPGENEGECFIHKLYIDPTVQGRGLGSAAIREIENRCGKQVGRRISLRVNRNNLQAIRVYEKAGFCRIDTVCSDIGGGFMMDDFVMAKDLG